MYTRSIHQTPFAGQTASRVGLCPTPACSNFSAKNRSLLPAYRAVARMLFCKQRHATGPVGVVAWLVVDVAAGYEFLDTFMVSRHGFDARKAHQLFAADLEVIPGFIRAVIEHGHKQADMGWQQTIIVSRVLQKPVSLR